MPILIAKVQDFINDHCATHFLPEMSKAQQHATTGPRPHRAVWHQGWSPVCLAAEDTFVTLCRAAETFPMPLTCPFPRDIPNSSHISCLVIPKVVGDPRPGCTPGAGGVTLRIGSAISQEPQAGGGTHQTGRPVSHTTR